MNEHTEGNHSAPPTPIGTLYPSEPASTPIGSSSPPMAPVPLGSHWAAFMQPGIIPLRPLTVGPLFSAVFKSLRGNFGSTLGLSFVVTMVVAAPALALTYFMAQTTFGSNLPDMPPEALGTFRLTNPIGMILSYLLNEVGYTLIAVACAYIIGQATFGRKVAFGETFSAGIRRVLPAIGATFLVLLIQAVVFAIPVAILIFSALNLHPGKENGSSIFVFILSVLAVGVLIIVPVHLFLWTRLGFSSTVVMLEKVGPVQALRRSWALSKGGDFWRILGIRLLFILPFSLVLSIVWSIASIAVMAATFPSDGQSADLPSMMTAQLVMNSVVSALISSVLIPCQSLLDSCLYIDQRMRREGFDLTLARAATGEIPTPWPLAERSTR